MVKDIRIGLSYLNILIITNILAASFFYIIDSKPSDVIKDVNLQVFISAVMIAPPIEEFFFRFLPIRLTQLITSDKKILWIVILIISAIFGYLHGSWHHIFIQGFTGIILSLAFLKGGYVTSTSLHMSFNCIIATLIWLF